MCDNICSDDLWNVGGSHWKISEEDNFIAELAAIHKSIRAPPTNINVSIYSDSLSCIQSINECMASGPRFNPLRKAGRPYILAITRAIRAREKYGASSAFHHVRSHTGKRDAASVGNAAADFIARFAALSTDTSGPSYLNQMNHELKYVLMLNDKKKGDTPIHGDIRKAIKMHLSMINDRTWAERECRGRLIRSFPTQVSNIIKTIWNPKNYPSSDSVMMALIGLTMVTRKYKTPEGDFKDMSCPRCGTGALTPIHALHSCPRNASALNERDIEITEILGIPRNTEDHTISDLLTRYAFEGSNIVSNILCAKPHGPKANTRSLKYTHNRDGLPLSPPGPNIDPNILSDPVYLSRSKLCHLLSVQGARTWDGTNFIATTVPDGVWQATADAVWDTVSDLHTTKRRYHALDWRLACRDTLRTYSDVHYNPLVSPDPWGATWHTQNPNMSTLGGTYAPSQSAFMADRYSIIALTEDPNDQESAITEAGKAMQASSLPARVAILAMDTTRNRLLVTSLTSGKVRSHILASAPPESLYLSPIEMNYYGLESSPRFLNPSGMILILVENRLAPGFMLSSLRNAVPNLNVNHNITWYPAPWDYSPVPDDFLTRLPNTSPERLPPSSYPKMLWCRTDIPAAIITSDGPTAEAIKSLHATKRPTKSDQIHALLACLGITPPDLQKTYNIYASSEQFFDAPPKLTNISKIILHSTLDIVRKSEAMRKWKRKNSG